MLEKNQPSNADTEAETSAATSGRRDFLKGVATASAAGVAMVQQAQAAAPAVNAAAAKLSDVDAKAVESGRLIPRPGSDFMVDVIKSLNLEYVAANPGSSFRSLHESVVNYGGNKAPELITCLHEESSVAIAHGYAKAAGKPMAVMAHGSVGFSACRHGGLQRMVRPCARHHVWWQWHRCRQASAWYRMVTLSARPCTLAA